MDKNINKFSHYRLADFLLDPDFKQWIIHPNEQINAYWDHIIKTYPHQKDTIDKAINIVKNLPENQKQQNLSRAQSLWDKIDKEISSEVETPEKKKPVILKFHILQSAKYAAVLIAAITTILLVIHFKNNEKIVIATGNGENKAFDLPDGSKIELAPNSSVSYLKNMDVQAQREVWANGEVNFKVKHINKNPDSVKKGERFVVHLNQSIDVQVLGTVFNINNRHGNASVYLESGSVKISRANQQLLLKPGQSAVSDQGSKKIRLDKSAPALVYEWENHMLILNKTKISTIIGKINDAYGVKLSLSDKNLLNKEIDGSIPLDDYERALGIVTSITGGKVADKTGNSSIKK